MDSGCSRWHPVEAQRADKLECARNRPSKQNLRVSHEELLVSYKIIGRNLALLRSGPQTRSRLDIPLSISDGHDYLWQLLNRTASVCTHLPTYCWIEPTGLLQVRIEGSHMHRVAVRFASRLLFSQLDRCRSMRSSCASSESVAICHKRNFDSDQRST